MRVAGAKVEGVWAVRVATTRSRTFAHHCSVIPRLLQLAPHHCELEVAADLTGHREVALLDAVSGDSAYVLVCFVLFRFVSFCFVLLLLGNLLHFESIKFDCQTVLNLVAICD
jgi:hypothetical protein